MTQKQELHAVSTLTVGQSTYQYADLNALGEQRIERLPFSLRVLLENLLRHDDGSPDTRADIEALLSWDPQAQPTREIAFRPARVLMQDFTGVPAIVDLAAMRAWLQRQGGDPGLVNPLQPTDLVIDHSVQVDAFGSSDAAAHNRQREFERNEERYAFLRWGQQAFENFRVVPPNTGIVHQVNLEYLARVVMVSTHQGHEWMYPDTVVGTDSHTTMVNALGVVGWGVGGIEAEAVMMGQPISMLIPQVVGMKLTGQLQEGATATDVVLTVTQILRAHGVVGRFVEFFGEGLDALTLPDRATIANMSPEYGATIGFFPVDEQTLDYLTLTGRDSDTVEQVSAYCQQQTLMHSSTSPTPEFTDVLELNLATVTPSLAGPNRPQDRLSLSDAKSAFRQALVEQWSQPIDKAPTTDADSAGTLTHGSVVIAAITSCTNTSNPSVMLSAGLLAKNAVEHGLDVKPWVKTSLAPGSQVVMEYLQAAGLLTYLEQLRFHLVGFGCTTCIGNSGPLPEAVAKAVKDLDLVAVAVLSGNRNFEGRINPLVRASYLASPPLVVAYALVGSVDIDLTTEPLGEGNDGAPVYLQDIWPTSADVAKALQSVGAAMFREQYANVFEGDEAWKALEIPTGQTYAWDDTSSYVQHPPFFQDMEVEPQLPGDIVNARVLALLGDSVTTDHISPAGAIPTEGPAGQYLVSNGIDPQDFNSFGSRRGNHEVMLRGTFGNIRLRNLLAEGTEGGWTTHQPTGELLSIYEASVRYQQDEVPLLVIAGQEYGSGSSRDWAAKGTALLGVRAVLAESYERIHRSNLIGMGVLPLEFLQGDTRDSLGLTGTECYTIRGIADGLTPGLTLSVDADDTSFQVTCRIDTPQELEYFQHGGILHYVLRQLLASDS